MKPFIVLGMLVACVFSPRPASAVPCGIRAFSLVPMPDGMTHAISVRSHQATVASLKITVFGRADSYSVTAPDVAVQYQLKSPFVPSFWHFEADPIFVSLPAGAMGSAVKVEIVGPNAKPCDADYAFVDSARHLPNSPLQREAVATADRTFGSGSKVLVAAADDKPYATPCEKPFADVFMLKASRIKQVETLPAADYRATALVDVDADGKGSSAFIVASSGFPEFDAEMARSLLQSEFSPAVVACRRVPSHYGQSIIQRYGPR